MCPSPSGKLKVGNVRVCACHARHRAACWTVGKFLRCIFEAHGETSFIGNIAQTLGLPDGEETK